MKRSAAGASRCPDSPGSILSIGSAGSILSIGSAGSVLSIGSVGSAASIGSVYSFASVGSVCSALSVLGVLRAGRGPTWAALAGMVVANRRGRARLSRRREAAAPG